MPDIGDFKDVEVIEVLVKPGDTVAREQSLITVESDKASMEIPSSDAGVVKEMQVKLGDKVSKGSPVLLLEATGATAAPPAEATAAARPGHGRGSCSGACAGHRGTGRSGCGRRHGRGRRARHRRLRRGRGDRGARQAGDTVAKEQCLITVESDKASMEIPSSAAGVVKELRSSSATRSRRAARSWC